MRLVFEYVIRLGNAYYSGKAGSDYLTPFRGDAHTYTEAGAHAKIERMGWTDATVHNVHDCVSILL